MALPPNVLNSARQLMSQTSNYRGAPVQTGATKPAPVTPPPAPRSQAQNSMIANNQAYWLQKNMSSPYYNGPDQAGINAIRTSGQPANTNAYNRQGIQSSFDIKYGPGGKPPPLTEDFLYALGSTGPGWMAEAQRAQALSGQGFSRPLEQYGAGYAPPPAPVPQSAPAPAPATSGIQWTPEDMERELQRIRSEGITWNSGNRQNTLAAVDAIRFQNDPNYRNQILQLQQTYTAQSQLPYMQTMFDRLRAAQLQNRLQPRVNPVTRF